jgi:hypothetical protein
MTSSLYIGRGRDVKVAFHRDVLRDFPGVCGYAEVMATLLATTLTTTTRTTIRGRRRAG